MSQHDLSSSTILETIRTYFPSLQEIHQINVVEIVDINKIQHDPFDELDDSVKNFFIQVDAGDIRNCVLADYVLDLFRDPKSLARILEVMKKSGANRIEYPDGTYVLSDIYGGSIDGDDSFQLRLRIRRKGDSDFDMRVQQLIIENMKISVKALSSDGYLGVILSLRDLEMLPTLIVCFALSVVCSGIENLNIFVPSVDSHIDESEISQTRNRTKVYKCKGMFVFSFISI